MNGELSEFWCCCGCGCETEVCDVIMAFQHQQGLLYERNEKVENLGPRLKMRYRAVLFADNNVLLGYWMDTAEDCN